MPITTTTITNSVIELYTTVLGRVADSNGLQFWTDTFTTLIH
jgi:hypothetical protein